MNHISDGIKADLSKLDPSHRREIRRVAGSDTQGSNAKGANAPVAAVGMNRKVAAPAVVPPDPPIIEWPRLAPTSAKRPDLVDAAWPRNRGTYKSGHAKAGRIS